MTSMTPADVRELLRQVACPGRSRDIVALGFIKSVGVEGRRVAVDFNPDIQNVDKILTMEDGIRAVLAGAGFTAIELETEPPYDDSSMLLGGPSTNPLQIDLGEYGIDPNPDLVEGPGSRARNLLEPEAPKASDPLAADGLDEFAAAQRDGPQGNSDPGYQGPLPVFQWEVDSDDEMSPPTKVKLSIDSWNFVVCWLEHGGQDLVYASLQARHWIRDGEKARPNPAGRVEGVNLVFDPERGGVIAIYGTVRDFRPFVEAFRRAYGGEGRAEEGAVATTRAPHSA